MVTFPQLVAWLFDALVEHRGSGRQAHLQRTRQPDDACNETFYGKLRRLPLPLSEAFLRDITDRFTPLIANENTFQKVTEIFALARFIGSTAEVTVFQASMCFVLSNLVQILQGFAVAKQKLTLEDISTHQFFKDWHRQLVALKELVPVNEVVSLIPPDLTAQSIGELLNRLLADVWKAGWTKTRNKTPRTYRLPTKRNGAHDSVQRRRNAAKRSSRS